MSKELKLSIDADYKVAFDLLSESNLNHETSFEIRFIRISIFSGYLNFC